MGSNLAAGSWTVNVELPGQVPRGFRLRPEARCPRRAFDEADVPAVLFWQRAGPTANAGANDLQRKIRIDAPSSMNSNWTAPCSGPQPIADRHAVQQQRARRSPLISRPVTTGCERTMRHTNRRHIDDGAQVDSQPRAPRMIPPGTVDQQHIRRRNQTTYHGLENRSHTHAQESRNVRRTRTAGHAGPMDTTVHTVDGRASP
jgi:hypothetical protein